MLDVIAESVGGASNVASKSSVCAKAIEGIVEYPETVCGGLSTAWMAVWVGAIPLYSVEAAYELSIRGHWDSELWAASYNCVGVKSKS